MFVLSPISKNINSFIIILCSSINLFDEQNGILFWVWQNGKLTFPAFEWHHFDPRRCVFRFDINKEDKINGGLVLSVFVCVFKMGHISWLLHWKNLFWSWQHERDGRWWGLKETTRVRSLIGNWWPQRESSWYFQNSNHLPALLLGHFFS